MNTSFQHRMNKEIRHLAMQMMSTFKGKSEEVRLDVYKERIEKILLVRTTFRIGESILVTPAISLLRRNFPQARIDFVGGPISGILFQNLPINHHYEITRRFPNASWAYILLLKQICSVGYDLAVELSCSQSAMGSFIVGFSGARFKVGKQGKWDHWFNVKIPKPIERSRYKILPTLLASLGLDGKEVFPSIVLSSAEKEEGKGKIEAVVGKGKGPIVGVFVGGRKDWGKRWPKEHFLELIASLRAVGVMVVVFAGPEEKDLFDFFGKTLDEDVPLMCESSVRIFVAMVSNCQLFVACDSGPMHLACAVGVRTIAIFQNPNFERWGPSPNLGRIVYQPGGASPREVLEVCLQELVHISASLHPLRTEDRQKRELQAS
jgi:ADP-heptose:LPS heptosyltransferase